MATAKRSPPPPPKTTTEATMATSMSADSAVVRTTTSSFPRHGFRRRRCHRMALAVMAITSSMPPSLCVASFSGSARKSGAVGRLRGANNPSLSLFAVRSLQDGDDEDDDDYVPPSAAAKTNTNNTVSVTDPPVGDLMEAGENIPKANTTAAGASPAGDSAGTDDDADADSDGQPQQQPVSKQQQQHPQQPQQQPQPVSKQQQQQQQQPDSPNKTPTTPTEPIEPTDETTEPIDPTDELFKEIDQIESQLTTLQNQDDDGDDPDTKAFKDEIEQELEEEEMELLEEALDGGTVGEVVAAAGPDAGTGQEGVVSQIQSEVQEIDEKITQIESNLTNNGTDGDADEATLEELQQLDQLEESLLDEIDEEEKALIQKDNEGVDDDVVLEEMVEEYNELEDLEEDLYEDEIEGNILGGYEEEVHVTGGDDNNGTAIGYYDDAIYDDALEELEEEIEEIEDEIEQLQEEEDDDGAKAVEKEEEVEQLEELEGELIEEELEVLGFEGGEEYEDDDYRENEVWGANDNDDGGDSGGNDGNDDYENNVANVDDATVGEGQGGNDAYGDDDDDDAGPVIDPILTMDLTQYNTNGTLIGGAEGEVGSAKESGSGNPAVEGAIRDSPSSSNVTGVAEDSPADNAEIIAESVGISEEGEEDDDDYVVPGANANVTGTKEAQPIVSQPLDDDEDDDVDADITAISSPPCEDDAYYLYKGEEGKNCNKFIAMQDEEKRTTRCNKNTGIMDENTNVEALVSDFCKASCGTCTVVTGVEEEKVIVPSKSIGSGGEDADTAGTTLPSTPVGTNATETTASVSEPAMGGGNNTIAGTPAGDDDATVNVSNSTDASESEGSIEGGENTTSTTSTTIAPTMAVIPPADNTDDDGDEEEDDDGEEDYGDDDEEDDDREENYELDYDDGEENDDNEGSIGISPEDESQLTSFPTRKPTEKPTYEYVESTDDDPVANEEEIIENEAFQNGENVPSASEGGDGSTNNDDGSDDILKEEEEELKKIGGWMSFASMVLMVYTAYQMSENPDGVCASLCRLSITVIGCVLKIMLIPFKFIIGGGRPSGGHYMATPDYRDPYGSRHLELT